MWDLYAEGNPINAIDPSGNVSTISFVQITASDEDEQFALAFKGSIEGVGLSNILFVLNLLGASFNRGSLTDDELLEVAFQKTETQLDDLIKTLTNEDIPDERDLIKSFVSGVGVDISFTLPSPINEAIELTGKEPPSISKSFRVSGFEDGFRQGLDYVKAKFSGTRFPF